MPLPFELCIRDFRPCSSMTPHLHEAASISLLVRGRFTECIAGAEREYLQGEVAYLPQGVVHSQDFGAAGARQIICRAQPDWIDYLSDCRAPLADSPHANTPLFRQLGSRLVAELSQCDRHSALACEGLMLEIVAAFGRHSRPTSSPRRPPPWLTAVRDLVQERALERLSLPEIAQAAGRHEIHVAREFRRFFGASVGEFVRRVRTEQAARLLSHSRASISDVALSCGFSSHSHLCRAFRAHFGTTPSEYRAIAAR
jgi:AraC family transcriptional regulator